MHNHSVVRVHIAVPATPALPGPAPALKPLGIRVFAALVCVLALALFAARPPVAAAQSGPPEGAQKSAPDTVAPDTAAPDPAGLGPFAVYQSDGTVASLAQIEAALDTVDVLLIGETHDDPAAHALQDSLFRRAQTVAASSSRPLALSLEMFERDVQPVVDEYLAGIISERHFIDDARAWSSYRSAYARLVNRARDGGHPVLAANAPRRYVNLVARSGPSALQSLSDQALGWLAPLPYPGPTPAYQQKWRDLMRKAMPPRPRAHGQHARGGARVPRLYSPHAPNAQRPNA